MVHGPWPIYSSVVARVARVVGIVGIVGIVGVAGDEQAGSPAVMRVRAARVEIYLYEVMPHEMTRANSKTRTDCNHETDRRGHQKTVCALFYPCGPACD